MVRLGRSLLGTALCSLLGLVPLYRLRGQSLWFDELFTVWVAARPGREIFHHAAADGFTPPLYYLLVAGLQRLGLANESLRILSVAAGVLALLGVGRLAHRLGGTAASVLAVTVMGLSPFFVSLAQELRPYTAFLAAAAWSVDALVAWRERPTPGRALAWGGLTLLAITLSYLGFALVPIVLAVVVSSRARRSGLAVAAGLLLLALPLSWPGLGEGAMLLRTRAEASRIRFEAAPMYPLGRLVLGQGVRLPPLETRDTRPLRAAQIAGGAVLVLALVIAVRRRDRVLFAVLSVLALTVAALVTADALMGLGLPTRYLALGFVPFVLTLALVSARAPWLGGPLLAAVLALQLFGLYRYLFDPTCAREDWRGLSRRLLERYRAGDVVLGFPLHHLAVAAAAYAPDLPVSGGFVGRPGEPVYLWRAGAVFAGYDLAGRLERVDERAPAALTARTEGRRVLLVTYADPEGHGDPRPVVEALATTHATPREERFPGREALVLRVFEAGPGSGSGEREER